MTPVFADGRGCGETTNQTDVCPLILALNASQVGNNIVVTYTAGDAHRRARLVERPLQRRAAPAARWVEDPAVACQLAQPHAAPPSPR